MSGVLLPLNFLRYRHKPLKHTFIHGFVSRLGGFTILTFKRDFSIPELNDETFH